MERLPILARLPPGYRIEAHERGVAVCSEAWADDLRRAGYGPASEPATRPSALAGRRALEEIATPRGVLLLRRFTHGGLLRTLTGARFRDAERPFRELLLAHELTRLGIATAPVAAARARRAQGLGWYLDVVTLRLEPSRDLESLLADARRGALERRRLAPLARALGELVRRMHEVGFLHADLTTKNVVVHGTPVPGAAPTLALLDLDRSRFEAPLAAHARMGNLGRLLRFVLRREAQGARALTRTDLLRFLAGYEPRRAERKALWRALEAAHARALVWHRLGWLLEEHRRG